MRRLGLTLAATAMAVLAAAPSAAAVATPPDRVIVEWAPGASPNERRAVREDAEVDFARDLGNRRFQLLETEPGQSPREAARELEADPVVVLAEPDGYVAKHAIPDDPLFGQLWGLPKIGASSAWDRTVGTPTTVVADIDDGYRFEHPDLDDVYWTNPGEAPNGLDDDGNGIPDDLHGADFVGANAEEPAVDGDPTDDDLYEGGHGVHTAGTIGAEGNNGVGVTGVAQDVSIMPLRVCSRFVLEEESFCLASAIVEAINYAGAKGARAANMSLGSETYRPSMADAIAANPGTLYVVSAGNDEENNDATPHYPCNYDPPAEGKGAVDNVICVAATDQADGLAWFSDWGAKSVDLGAPGTEVLSTYPITDVIGGDFELDDFASRWIADGPDGGFGRTDEPPLTSFGMGDSPGTAAVPDSVRASKTTLTVSPGFNECTLELTHWVSGGILWLEAFLDDEQLVGVGLNKNRRYDVWMWDRLSAGGELTVRLSYEANSTLKPGDGAWIDDIELNCLARVGEPGGYEFLQGTSMAAPHVTGAAALLFSQKPSASVAEVRQALLGSVDRIPALAGKTSSGGRLDAGAALDLFDAVPPPAPALSAKPASPSSNAQPRLTGAAQPGVSIDLFAGPDCSGSPLATVTAAQLAGPGVAVAVAEEATTQFSARATDLAPLASPCSAPLSYTHRKATPDPGEGGGDEGGGGPAPSPGGGGGGGGGPAAEPDPGKGTPAPSGPSPAPACVVPKLTGKTLAQAKAALTAAACRLGTVRKPRPRPGKRLPPLVVRSSTPAAGAPAPGKVGLTLGPKSRRA
ncbi:MAG TPA: S8 family peptidase [Solirubrobacterales bacterium]|nr:S8 family peptidase [Solirubrobacterales bacterium]